MAEKKCSKGAPKWATTFADMSTNLMTFFVLMLSFANTDVQKFRDMLGSVQNAFGVQLKQKGEFQATTTDTSSDINPTKVIEKLKEMADDLNKAIEQQQLKDETNITTGTNSIRMRIKGQIMFDAGKAVIKPEAFQFLDGIFEVMNKYDYYLLVEGHTDSLKISTYQYPSNWELSGARAAAVVTFLIEKGTDSRRLSGIGHAHNYPIASNKTSEGRNLNRRVEFIFTKTPFRDLIE